MPVTATARRQWTSRISGDVQDPQHRRDAREHERGRVHAADDLHDDGEDRRILPAGVVAQRADRRARASTAAPANGSSSTEIRDAKSSVYGVSMKRSTAAGTPGPRTASVRRRIEHAEAGEEEDGAEPDPLGDPGGHAQPVEHPEEGAHREQVADVLVGDRARDRCWDPTSTPPGRAADRDRGTGSSWCRRRPDPAR